jgi:hypothetical protein
VLLFGRTLGIVAPAELSPSQLPGNIFALVALAILSRTTVDPGICALCGFGSGPFTERDD